MVSLASQKEKKESKKFFLEKRCYFKIIMYICRQNGEKSVSIDALACYFALYRKDVGNLVWNSSINEQKGKTTDVVPV